MSPHKKLLGNIELPLGIQKLSYKQLAQLASETRDVIINTVAKTGGHLAPSLGVVELTIALLRVCNPLDDRIIWDVSHQSYPFKVLTDRLDKFHTLRTYGGISGFSKPSESPYEAFGTGHSSTSISAGQGIATADKLLGRNRKVISVIGDGALSGGMAFEALNNLGDTKLPMVVVLNDNEMSISENVGAVSSSLSRMLTGEIATSIRKDARRVLEAFPSQKLRRIARKFEESMLSFFTPGILFEEFGLQYIGPINGHNIRDIEKALRTAFSYNAPALVHIATTKGKGYVHAENNPAIFHGVSSFDVESGQTKPSAGKSWTDVFGEKIVSLAERDSRVVAITAAMRDGTGLEQFSEKFPDRFYDTGIAEQHAVTFAAGLAIAGIIPYVAIYSTFTQRAFDQIIHDVAIQRLPVRICIDRAGLVGQDGPTHHGSFDISFLRIIPNLTLFLPRDAKELEMMMDLSLDWDGPVAIRYARGVAEETGAPMAELTPYKPDLVYPGKRYMIVSVGHIFSEAHKLYEMMAADGLDTGLINLRFINALDTELLCSWLKDADIVVTFEDNARAGGAGEMIECLVAEHGLCAKVLIRALPNGYVTHGSVKELREECGLTAEQSYAEVKQAII